jgi:predicted AAA+ superfamily ATPase
MLTELLDVHTTITSDVPRQFERQPAIPIDWNASSIGIVGGRGVGKTTLLLQQYWARFGTFDRALYISADHVQVATHGLYEIAKTYFKRGGDALLIDEVHRSPDWTRQVKSILDTWKNKRVWLSGSSSAALVKGASDLSRRVLWYELPTMSFREYLELHHGRKIAPFPLEELLTRHVEIGRDLMADGPLLAHFRDYLKFGSYPFLNQGRLGYHQRIQSIVDKVISEDLPSLFGITPAKVHVLRKILGIIASSHPFQPNMEGLSQDLGVARMSVYHFVECLCHGRLLRSLMSPGRGARAARKPEKIYIENTSILAALTSPRHIEPEVGTVRETFLASQLAPCHSIQSAGTADFLVDNQIVIEVGGPSKDRHQLPHAKSKNRLRAVRALDGIETGSGDRIPLHLFGLVR